MAKFICLFIPYLLYCLDTMAQKPVVDSSMSLGPGQWPSLSFPRISNDGRYISYLIDNIPADGHTLVIQSTENDWKRTFPNKNGANAFFSRNNKQAIFMLPGDSLVFLSLGNSE